MSGIVTQYSRESESESESESEAGCTSSYFPIRQTSLSAVESSAPLLPISFEEIGFLRRFLFQFERVPVWLLAVLCVLAAAYLLYHLDAFSITFTPKTGIN